MSKPGKGWARVRPANYQIEPKPGRGEANLGPSRAVGTVGAGWAQLTAGLRPGRMALGGIGALGRAPRRRGLGSPSARGFSLGFWAGWCHGAGSAMVQEVAVRAAHPRGRGEGIGGKPPRGEALPRNPAQDVPGAVPCPSWRGASTWGGGPVAPGICCTQLGHGSQLPKTQRVCRGGSLTPGRYASPVSHGGTPVLLGWGLRTGEMLRGSFAFCVLCRNVPLPPPPLPGVILLGTQGTHQSLLGIFTSLVQVSGNMRGICR